MYGFLLGFLIWIVFGNIIGYWLMVLFGIFDNSVKWWVFVVVEWVSFYVVIVVWFSIFGLGILVCFFKRKYVLCYKWELIDYRKFVVFMYM